MTRHDSNDLSQGLNARISELMRELCPEDEAMQTRHAGSLAAKQYDLTDEQARESLALLLMLARPEAGIARGEFRSIEEAFRSIRLRR